MPRAYLGHQVNPFDSSPSQGYEQGECILLGKSNGWVCSNSSPPHFHVFLHVTCKRSLIMHDFDLLK